MNSARRKTRSRRRTVSLTLVVLVIATASAAWGQTQDLVTKVEALTLNDGTPASGIASISGNTAVVGHDGVVHVFRRERGGNHWLHTATLTPSDGTSGFGRSVAVDGRTVVVGADSAAFVFERTRGLGWQEVQKLTGDTNAFSFGQSVAVSRTTVVVGAPMSQSPGPAPGIAGDPGLAYVFERDDGGAGAWAEIARLFGPPLTDFTFVPPDFFGSSVSIDRDTAAVGARIGAFSGRPVAYVFMRHVGGPDAWGRVAALQLLPDSASVMDAEPAVVSISGDTAIAGSIRLSFARIFERNQGGPNVWGAVVDLRHSGPGPALVSSSEVSISGDLAVISGSPGAFVFARHQGESNSWGEVARIFAAGGIRIVISGDTMLAGNRRFNPAGQTPIDVYVADTDRDGTRDRADPCPRDPLNNVAGDCQRASAVQPVLDELIAQGEVTSETHGRKEIITATFTNTSDTAVQNPFFEVTELTGHNMLLNGDAGRGRIGATLSPDMGDGVLSPGESMTVTFRIRLRTPNPFQFFVTFHGDPLP